jgi:pyruvate dehydrogenase E2 component (dihydrolipoamide acetyltransferase)
MIEFKFPDIGEGIAQGRLLKWMVKKGDAVKEGHSLFLVETDKVNAEIPSPVSGKVAELMAEEGDVINVGDVVVKLLEEGSEASKGRNAEVEEENAGVVGAIEVSSEIIHSSSEGNTGFFEAGNKVLATPVARKLAKDLGLDISKIMGTGPAGRVMKEDIYKTKEMLEHKREIRLEAAADNIVAKSSVLTNISALNISGDTERLSLTTLEKTIARNIATSKKVIPHATAMDEFDVTELVKFRSEAKQAAQNQSVKLTYMPFIIKALTLTLKEFPVFNASFDEEKQEIVLKKYYNVGVAVDTPEGLLVPVVKDTDKQSVLQLGKALQKLADDARNKSITIDKLQNGTITITNYGAIGVSIGVPVIRYPESAILGVGTISKKPVVNELDEIVVRHMMPVSLSFDHRIIDGGSVGRFINRLKRYLQDPMLLLLS